MTSTNPLTCGCLGSREQPGDETGGCCSSRAQAVVHLDHTSALTPLERTPLWDTGEPPETYPTGL